MMNYPYQFDEHVKWYWENQYRLADEKYYAILMS